MLPTKLLGLSLIVLTAALLLKSCEPVVTAILASGAVLPTAPFNVTEGVCVSTVTALISRLWVPEDESSTVPLIVMAGSCDNKTRAVPLLPLLPTSIAPV